MKKYILFIGLLVGCLALQARNIAGRPSLPQSSPGRINLNWVEGFVNNPEGIPASGGSYTIFVEVSYRADMGEIYNDIFTQVARQPALQWVKMNGYGGSRDVFQISFLMEENKTGFPRSIEFVANGDVAVATQPSYPSLQSFSITSSNQQIEPGDPVKVVLSGSEKGVTYRLKRNGTSVATLSGTGAALTFQGNYGVGSYMIEAYKDGYTVAMSGVVQVSLKPLQQYTLTGGDLRITKGQTFTIPLSGSQKEATYQLLRNGTGVQTLTGTGAALSFTGAFGEGTYTVNATRAGESLKMSGQIQVSLRMMSFLVVGNTKKIVPGERFTVSLNGSEIGVEYRLKRGTTVVQSLSGTGAALDFTGDFGIGVYTVEGVRKTETLLMGGRLDVSWLIQRYTFQGSPLVIDEGQQVTLVLSGSETGVSYRLKQDGKILRTIAGTGSRISVTDAFSPGTYTLEGVKDGKTVQMEGQVVLTLRPLQTYQVTGGNQKIDAGGTVRVSLNGSQPGVTYRLKRNGTIIASLSGTGAALAFSGDYGVGTFTIEAVRNGVMLVMNGQVQVSLLLVRYVVSTTTAQIDVGQEVVVRLSSSETGVVYRLKRDGTVVGTLSGTGTALTFSGNYGTGTYTVEGSRTGEPDRTMTGSAVVTLRPLVAYSLTGKDVEIVSEPVAVGLSGSQTGVSYRLKRDGTVVATQNGTGSALAFSGTYGLGTYTIEGVRGTEVKQMTGQLKAILRLLSYALSETGKEVLADESFTLTLSGSQSGVSYRLKRDGTVVSTKAGTGSSLAFTGAFGLGTYTAEAVKDDRTLAMNGQAAVVLRLLPYALSETGKEVLADESFTLTLSGSQPGVSYRLKRDGTVVSTEAGTGSSLAFTGAFGLGTYTAEAVKDGRTLAMSGQAAVVLRLLPYALSETGKEVLADELFTLTLSGSQPGVSYRLKRDGTVVSTEAGTGSSLAFTGAFGLGTYTAEAVKDGRTLAMNGQAAVVLRLVAYQLAERELEILPEERFTISIPGSQPGVTYLLKRDGIKVAELSGTGEALTFAGAWGIGEYTVEAEKDGRNVPMIGDVHVAMGIIPYTLTGDRVQVVPGEELTFSLSGSQAGVTYRLKRDGTQVAALAGTGTGLTFTGAYGPGTYTAEAVRENKEVPMNGQIAVDASTDNVVIAYTYRAAGGQGKTGDYTYYDDLGRPVQQKSLGATPLGKDLVISMENDFLGRAFRTYLAYPTSVSSGVYQKEAVTEQNTYYKTLYGLSGTDAYAYEEKRYEVSALNRVAEQASPGEAFRLGNGHSVRFTYGTNASGEVKRFKLVSGTVTPDGYYDPATLYRTLTTDEDGNRTEVFQDYGKKTILERRYESTSVFLDTYYVYDAFDRLVCVIPPGANTDASLSATEVENFCYRYEYNAEGEVSQKKVPGAAVEHYTYNASHLLATRTCGDKHFSYDYDAHNRLVREKCRYGTATQDVVLSEYVYDERPATGELGFVAVAGFPAVPDNRLKGYKVYEKLRILDSGMSGIHSGTGKYIERAFYYDAWGRLIQTVEKNQVDGISRYTVNYDFTGNILAEEESHTLGGTTTTVRRTNTYDHRGRALSQEVFLNGSSKAKVTYAYNELGALEKIVYGNNLTTEQRKYNLRGLLSEQSSDFFSLSLRYEAPTRGTGRYNGNISEWSCKLKDKTEQLYTFGYDGLARLTGSDRYENGVKSNLYTEQGIRYDKNGNLSALRRTGTATEELAYRYTGNQLTSLSVNGITTNYTYDVYGNMTKDGHRALNIEYNFLNLLNKVQNEEGLLVTYTYASDGRKLSVKDGNGNGYVYIGDCIYSFGVSSLIFESAGFKEGRISSSSTSYYQKDHLGSVRVIFDAGGVLKEENDYYPFGLQQARADYTQQGGNRFKYNGKEEQTTGNLGYLDYGARPYDPYTGRWLSVDPLTEKQKWLSVYNFCNLNPINRIDVNGTIDDWVKNNKTEKYEWMDNVTSVNNTPEGYSYIGSKNEDILSDLGMNNTFVEKSSNRIGYIAADAELGKFAVNHMVNVKNRATIDISANITYNYMEATENNVLGRRFEKINISSRMITSHSSVDGILNPYAILNIIYNGESYSSSFNEPIKPYFKQTGTMISISNVSILASHLKKSSKLTIKIRGGWWITNSTGLKTPVVYHPLTMFPQTFRYKWNY